MLVNVKARRLSPHRAGEISEFFDDLRQDQADNLAAGLFGIYCQRDTIEETRDNVRLLFPRLWKGVSETQRQQFGVKYGRYVANGDDDEAEWARELLDAVDGSAYLPEPIRVAELSSAIEDLLRAHRGWDNFYAEPPRARLLERTVGDRGVPDGVREDYVGKVPGRGRLRVAAVGERSARAANRHAAAERVAAIRHPRGAGPAAEDMAEPRR